MRDKPVGTVPVSEQERKHLAPTFPNHSRRRASGEREEGKQMSSRSPSLPAQRHPCLPTSKGEESQFLHHQY